MNYEFVDWNAEAIRHEILEGLTEQQFIDRGIREGQYKMFNIENQKILLKEVYKRISIPIKD